MKIVHSLWTKPTLKKENLHNLDRNKGGWLDRKYNFISWALSALQFRKFYDEVELITDKMGYEILIEQLQLPYTSVRVELDQLNGYHPDLWALGKIYAYSVQDKPFIHVDGDIFIWSPFEDAIHESALLTQNIERGNLYYEVIYRGMKNHYRYIPEALFKSQKKNKEIISINAGVMGGTDYNFFKHYAKTAFAFIDKNYDDLDKMDMGFFNLIFEQNLFFALADEKDIPITYLVPNVNSTYDGLLEFTGVPERTNYIHTVGPYKREKYICEHMAKRLQLDYPEYYYRIMDLLVSYQI